MLATVPAPGNGGHLALPVGSGGAAGRGGITSTTSVNSSISGAGLRPSSHTDTLSALTWARTVTEASEVFAHLRSIAP